MKKHAIILIGLQASGKSTCYHRMWEDYREWVVSLLQEKQ